MLRVSSEQHVARQHTSCPLRAVMPFRERPRGLPVSLAVAVCLPFALNVRDFLTINLVRAICAQMQHVVRLSGSRGLETRRTRRGCAWRGRGERAARVARGATTWGHADSASAPVRGRRASHSLSLSEDLRRDLISVQAQ